MNTNLAQPNAVMFLRARYAGLDDSDMTEQIIDAQKQRCEGAAVELDATLIREYVEYGGAGAIDKRPILRLMLDELRALRDVKYVIVHKLDRLAHHSADWEAIRFELEAAGAELVIASEVVSRKEVSV